MTDINYAALRGGGGTTPPDGTYTARLAAAKLLDMSGGRLITEWEAGKYWWESWNRFDTSGLRWTQDLLDGLGIDRTTVTDDDALELELARVHGGQYIVRVETRTGSQGDRQFTSTYIEAHQASLDDIPADTTDLPDLPDLPAAVGAATPAAPEDDDIPF